MLYVRTIRALAFLFGLGCLLAWGASAAPAGEKNGKSESVFKKTESLTDKDEIDTGLMTKKSHRKVYKLKLMEGTAYRIDMIGTEKGFDSFIRIENAAGKEIAFNDDVAPGNLDSRLLFAPSKTGEYRIIATTFVPGQTGEFTIEVKTVTGAEAAEARLQTRLMTFGDATVAEQKKIVAEFTKGLMEKGDKLEIKDAQAAIQLAMMIDESEAAFTREACDKFGKIFEGAANKQLVIVGKILEQQVLKSLEKIGKEIEITGKTTDGKDFDLKSFKGKVVLVDFWATWCGPCVAEVPNIVEAHKKFHKQGFEVIGVSLDKGDAEIVKFLEDRNLPWKSIGAEDGRKLADRYGVNAIPHPILVGRDGRIVSTRARGPMLDRLLERMLAEKK